MSKNRYGSIYILVLLLLLISCGSTDTVTIITQDTKILVTVEIADTIDEQALGLMYRTELASNHGMLFVFDTFEKRTFWMKNTELILDIIFIDQDGLIVAIKENFEPCNYEPCDMFSHEAMYVLEVNGGFVAEYGIAVGDLVKIE